MENNPLYSGEDQAINFKAEIFRYLYYWPYILIIAVSINLAAFIYLRYVNYMYKSDALIEIIDKSQDSEMALPTAMTIFNRSMINLENESSVLGSYTMQKNVVKELNSNVKFYNIGNIKTSEQHHSEFFDDCQLDFNIDTDTVTQYFKYHLKLDENKLLINRVTASDDILTEHVFDSYSTYEKKHSLPFDLKINGEILDRNDRIIEINTVEKTADFFRNSMTIIENGKDSDQIKIELLHNNRIVANDYLNTLLSEFNKDGIRDRQLEYKNTIDFVDSRSSFLKNELEAIENVKKDFKEKNNLSDIKFDASVNVAQQFDYNSELFKSQSQKDLTKLLKESIEFDRYALIPVNIGLDNKSINELIVNYNLLLKDRDRFLLSAGPNNSILINIDKQLNSYYDNIIRSIDNFEKSLTLTVENLKIKEDEYENKFKDIPNNEKILRSINRELEVKEALFLLLLQKKEEAAINFAVIKPSIKIIDPARSSKNPVSPNSLLVYFVSIISSFALPILTLFIKFYSDTKIHHREHLTKKIKDIPVVGEIPFIEADKEHVNKIFDYNSRSLIAESIRMLIANLNFTLLEDDNVKNPNTFLVTSSIKGEGKTLVAVNIASLFTSRNSNVLLIGADLRNPQIHKYLNISKSTNGLSDYIYRDDLDWKNLILKEKGLDIMLSGTIPPNPTELLATDKFKNFINEVKNIYDYVIIDSAPCLLVSDTFEISKLIDTTLYVIRANHTEISICDFISDCKNKNTFNNMNLVLNSVGSSKSYGYSYTYGYKYGYRYGYNYGYGYGYSEEKD